ncbi:NlpC/P60 family protein [Cohnella soli]|uniref:NlpC/P60 family protein n=1 Tax=Cohnella soli TaxID=425005 RepID=A0ABW0HLP7_9BACL
MKLIHTLAFTVGLTAVATTMTGCAHNTGHTAEPNRQPAPVRMQSNGGASPSDLTEGRHIVPIRTLQNTGYVSLDDIAKATGFHGAWIRGGAYGVGDYDAAWVFRTGQSTVSIAGRNWTMPASAIKSDGRLFVPVSALQKLFGDVTVFAVEESDVAFFPKPTASETGVTGSSLNFADARPIKSAHPAKPAIAESNSYEAADTSNASKETVSADANSGSDDPVIAFARKYLGKVYEFGTATYSESGTFDCSSFTQYVFERFGVTLPRVARQQAESGTYVSRDNLHPGDLLFFYVPGRFKSDETVGHVGIYMGDGNMIHASPKPQDGVQITPINKAYWKTTFLYAKHYPLKE